MVLHTVGGSSCATAWQKPRAEAGHRIGESVSSEVKEQLEPHRGGSSRAQYVDSFAPAKPTNCIYKPKTADLVEKICIEVTTSPSVWLPRSVTVSPGTTRRRRTEWPRTR
jgi:hypothetical protein